MLDSICGEARRGVKVQFLHQIGAVFLNSLKADAQVLRDILIPIAFGDKLDDLSFPMAQQLPGRCRVITAQVTTNHTTADTGA